MARFKIDKKEAVEGIIEENLFSQPFMVELFGTEPEYELDFDISDDTDEGRDPIKKSHILVEIKASTQTVELAEAILNDFEIGLKNWLKEYDLETYFDAIYTNKDDNTITIAIDVPAQGDAWSPEKHAAKGLEVDGSYIPRVILSAIDRLKNAQDLPAGVMQEMVDKVVDEIRGAGDTNLNESYVFVDFLEKLSDEVRKSIKGETIDYLKSHPEDNTGLGNTLSVVDTAVIQYNEDKLYAEIEHKMKVMKMALDARAKTIKKEVHDAIDAGTQSPISYVITSAIRPKPSRAEDGKDLGKTTASFYKWGVYQGEEEFDLKDITGMVQLGQYELEGFDIRDEDIDKTFYARELDIDDTNVEEEGYGVKRAYAIEEVKASNGVPVSGQSFKVGDKVILEATYKTSTWVDRNVVEGVIEGTHPVTYNIRRLNKSGQPIKGRSGEILDPSPVYAHHLKHADSIASDGIDLTEREETGIEKMIEPLQKGLDFFKEKINELDKSTILDRIVGTTYNIVRLAKAKYEKGDDGWGSDYLGQHGIPTKVNDIENTGNIEDFGKGLNKLLEELRGYEKNLKNMPNVLEKKDSDKIARSLDRDIVADLEATDNYKYVESVVKGMGDGFVITTTRNAKEIADELNKHTDLSNNYDIEANDHNEYELIIRPVGSDESGKMDGSYAKNGKELKELKVISAEEVKPNSDEWMIETSDGKKELFYFYKEDSELDYHFSAGDDNDGYLTFRNADDTREAVAKAHSMTGNPDNPEWTDLDFHIVEEIEKKAKGGKKIQEQGTKRTFGRKDLLNYGGKLFKDEINEEEYYQNELLENDDAQSSTGASLHEWVKLAGQGDVWENAESKYTCIEVAANGKKLGVGEMADVRNKLRGEYNKNVSEGKEDGYPEYKANFENALFKKYAVLIADTGFDDAQIRSAYQKNEAVDNLVNYAGEKHQLTPIAAQGTAVEIKSPVKTKSVTAKSYLCVINDRSGKEIGSYQMSYNDDDYAKNFLSAIGVRLKPGDKMNITESVQE